MAREEFIQELQNIIMGSQIRQNIIAQALNLSPATLSQFLHGTALPSRGQLISLLDLLCIPPELTENMCAKLNAAKREMAEFPLPIIEEEVEVEEEEEEEEEPENDPPQSYSFKDDTPLGKIYRQQISNNTLIFREPAIKAIPVVYLDEFADFVPEKVSVEDFSNARQHDSIIRDYGSKLSPIVIKSVGTRLGMKYNGMISITVAPHMPVYMTEFYLTGFSGGIFRITPLIIHPGANTLEEIFPIGDISQKPLWQLPILELTITPLGLSQHDLGGIL